MSDKAPRLESVLDEKLNQLSLEQLDMLSELSPDELREALVTGTPPTPGQAVSEIGNDIAMDVTQVGGAFGDAAGNIADSISSLSQEAVTGPLGPTNPTGNLALSAAQSGVEAVRNDPRGVAELVGEAASAEAGLAAGAMLGGPLGAALGAAGGFALGDAATDLAKGEEVDVDPTGVALSGALPAAPAIMRGVGAITQGAGKVVQAMGSIRPNSLAGFIANRIDKAKNLGQAFGMSTSRPFRQDQSVVPFEALQRLEKRGVLSETASPSPASNFTKVREAFEEELTRLFGKKPEPGVPQSVDQVEISGAIGDAVKATDATGRSRIPFSEVEDAFDQILSQYQASTSTGKIDRAATKLFEDELNKLRELTLTPSESARFKQAQEVVRKGQAQIERSEVAAFRPMNEMPEEDIMKALGVKRKVHPETGEVEVQLSEKYRNFKEARSNLEQLSKEATRRSIKFSSAYAKRVSLDSFAQFGVGDQSTPFTAEAYTRLANMMRGKLTEAAGRSGRAGKEFLNSMEHVADAKAVSNYIFGSEGSVGLESPGMMLSFGGEGFVAREAAKEIRSNRFLLQKRRLGQYLRNSGAEVDGLASQVFSLAGSPLRMQGKLLDEAGAFTLNLANVMGSRRGAGELLKNTIIDSVLFSTLEDRGIRSATEETATELAQSPEIQEMIAAIEEQAAPLARELDAALRVKDKTQAGLILTTAAKQFPEAFQGTKSGIIGEIKIDGKRKLLDPVDQDRYRTALRNDSSLGVYDKAEAMSNLNEDGTVIAKPSGL